MIHLTLSTGHSRVSPRSEVSDDVIAALRPVVRAGGGMLPGPPGYRLVLTRDGRNAAYTIHRVDDGGAEAPPVTVHPRSDVGGVGRSMAASDKGSAHSPTSRRARAAGDLERCIAWTIIEDQP